jgi:hypothetical protein
MILFCSGKREGHLRECVKYAHRGGQGGGEGKKKQEAVCFNRLLLVRFVGLLDKDLIKLGLA